MTMFTTEIDRRRGDQTDLSFPASPYALRAFGNRTKAFVLYNTTSPFEPCVRPVARHTLPVVF